MLFPFPALLLVLPPILSIILYCAELLPGNCSLMPTLVCLMSLTIVGPSLTALGADPLSSSELISTGPTRFESQAYVSIDEIASSHLLRFAV